MKFLSRNLEVMAGIRAVERFIAEREVGDDVAFDRRLEQRPLKPRGVAQMAAFHAARGADPDPRKNIAAEAFNHRYALSGGRGGRGGKVDRAEGQPADEM